MVTFPNYLKQTTNIGMRSNAVILRVEHEGLTSFESLYDFDEKSIKALQSACKEEVDAIAADQANNIAAANAIPGVSISSKSIIRLIEACYAVHYYKSIGRTMDGDSLHYDNILQHFKTERLAYKAMKEDQDEPKVPLVIDKDGDRRIINWVPAFVDHCRMCYGAYGPIAYVLREISAVPPEADDELKENRYYGESGSYVEELIARLPHTGPIYGSDNSRVFVKIAEAVKGTTVESTVKSYARTRDGRGAFLALISNHAGEIKYRSLYKKTMHFLQNIKWTGNQYPLETHVSKHRKAHDQVEECTQHMACQDVGDEQKVEYLLDSVTCGNQAIQATLANIRSDRVKRGDFESSASSLIEVDPYKKRSTPGKPNANVSAIDYGSGRGTTGVDLRWHPRKEFLALPDKQKDELEAWLKDTSAGKKCKATAIKKIRKRAKGDKHNSNKKQKNIEEVSEVFALVAEFKEAKDKEEQGNNSEPSSAAAKAEKAISALTALSQKPATSTTLRGILRNKIYKKKSG